MTDSDPPLEPAGPIGPAGPAGPVGPAGLVGPVGHVPGELHVKRLDPRALLPLRAHPDDAGLDLHALEPVTLEPGRRASVRTGVAVAIPRGHAGLVLPRSGLAARHGIALVNAPGLIDAGYRGEIRVLLLNTDMERGCTVEAGDRVAQLVLVAVALPEVVEVAELDETDRGSGGFGSTGGFGAPGPTGN